MISKRHTDPLSEVGYGKLDATLASLKPKLDGALQPHGWQYIRLTAPDAFHDTHTFRIGMKGRLKSNDIQQDGQLVVATDGETIIRDRLIG